MVNLKNLEKKTKGQRIVSLAIPVLLLFVAVVFGNLVAIFTIKAGQIDRAIIGPLYPPLSFVLSFLFFFCSAAFYYRRTISRMLGPYLPDPKSGLYVLCALLSIAAILETLRIFLFMFIDYWPTDLPSYYYAGVALAEDKNPYDAQILSTLAGRRVFPYLYPPFLGVVFRCFHNVPIEIASSIWQCCTVLALFASIVLCLRLAEPSKDSARSGALITAVIVPLGFPFYLTAEHGSVSIIVAFFLILFFERLHRKDDKTAGIALGFASTIKALPIVLLLYLIIKKRYKALAATLVSGAALLGISLLFAPWDLHYYFATQVSSNIGYGIHSTLGFDPTFHPANQSINGFVSIYLCPDLVICKYLITAVCAALAIPAVWLVLKGKTSLADDAVLVILLLLLISPITWIHHMVAIVAPATIFASRIIDGSWRRKYWLSMPIAFAVICANDLGRPIMPIKFFPFLSHSRLFMVLAIYSYAIFCIQKGQTEKPQL